jgi:uncharacterized protein
MRRKYCEITDPKEILRILASTNIGRLATLDTEGYPYITPVNFVYYEECVYFHCAPEGEKLANLLSNPRVCFEADIPLAHLAVAFNPEGNPCRSHQLYHCVIIRGIARIVPNGELKTAVLNALMAKHEGNHRFPRVASDAGGYKACSVVEIRPERMTAKSDLAQNKPQEGYRHFIAERLVERGLPGDIDAVRAMGYDLELSDGVWRLSGGAKT